MSLILSFALLGMTMTSKTFAQTEPTPTQTLAPSHTDVPSTPPASHTNNFKAQAIQLLDDDEYMRKMLQNLSEYQKKVMKEEQEKRNKKQIQTLGTPQFTHISDLPLLGTAKDPAHPDVILVVSPHCGHCLHLIQEMAQILTTHTLTRSVAVWMNDGGPSKGKPNNPLALATMLVLASPKKAAALNLLMKTDPKTLMNDKKELDLKALKKVLTSVGDTQPDKILDDTNVQAAKKHLMVIHEKIEKLEVDGYPTVFHKDTSGASYTGQAGVPDMEEMKKWVEATPGQTAQSPKTPVVQSQNLQKEGLPSSTLQPVAARQTKRNSANTNTGALLKPVAATTTNAQPSTPKKPTHTKSNQAAAVQGPTA